MEQIMIRIYPNGEIKAETIGIKGGKCLQYLEIIEKLTNGKITDSEFTAEYLCTEEQNQNIGSEEVYV